MHNAGYTKWEYLGFDNYQRCPLPLTLSPCITLLRHSLNDNIHWYLATVDIQWVYSYRSLLFALPYNSHPSFPADACDEGTREGTGRRQSSNRMSCRCRHYRVPTVFVVLLHWSSLLAWFPEEWWESPRSARKSRSSCPLTRWSRRVQNTSDWSDWWRKRAWLSNTLSKLFFFSSHSYRSESFTAPSVVVVGASSGLIIKSN